MLRARVCSWAGSVSLSPAMLLVSWLFSRCHGREVHHVVLVQRLVEPVRPKFASVLLASPVSRRCPSLGRQTTSLPGTDLAHLGSAAQSIGDTSPGRSLPPLVWVKSNRSLAHLHLQIHLLALGLKRRLKFSSWSAARAIKCMSCLI